MKYIGIDPGQRRLGIAVSDPDGRLALPAGTIEEDDPEAQIEAILNAARTHAAEAIVVGMPYTLRGEIGPTAERVQRQVQQLRERTGIVVFTHDERFSSGIAERVLLEADVSRQKRKHNIDKLAASVMLQSFLDRRIASREHED